MRRSFRGDSNLKVTINGCDLHKLMLPIFNPNPKVISSLGIGHNAKAEILDERLALWTHAKVALELYRKGILGNEDAALYQIQIEGWSGRCSLVDLYYSDTRNTHTEDICLIFQIEQFPSASSSDLLQILGERS